MDIFLKGEHNNEEAAESLLSVLKLFQERYQITQFRHIHLSLVLVDKQGEEVELVDDQTNKVYRNFEVFRNKRELSRMQNSPLQLVVDNTKNNL